LQSLFDFFKVDLRQSPDMASESSTNLEEVSAIFQYFTRFMLNLWRLRQKISASALSVPLRTFLHCGLFTLRFGCKKVLGLSVSDLIHNFERVVSTNTVKKLCCKTKRSSETASLRPLHRASPQVLHSTTKKAILQP